ncbi:GNAT family N-acetyltransferase [Oscillibacter sp.]|uniref:GNAT family N-acetyltransferase n=1 Tax=Oscillibacter sp. TaxID=1945593 RepID=UPI0026150179|nr:GNAT family N-acetyltransferase [Oscillibacter sp.]MDD3346155.1 GNAT family N-acetyltransferase [Oscillibacter sp.]
MTRIYLIRHAEAEGNLYRIAQGQYDSILTDRGWRQVHALERRFADIAVDAVYSSDLYRTCATASALCKPKGLSLHRRRDLREISVGDWEQQTWGEIYRRDPVQMENFSRRLTQWHTAGAERPEAVRDRVLGAVREIAEKNEGRTVAVFSHGYAIRLLLATLQGCTLEEVGNTPHGDNTAVSLLEAEKGALRVVFRDDNSHLQTPEFLAGEKVRSRDSALEPGLWFAPLKPEEQASFLTDCVAEVWPEVGGGRPFQKERLLSDAARRPTLVGYLGEEPVGLLQLGPAREWISLVCVRRQYRTRGFGVQMIGQAVQHVRPLGGEALRIALPKDSSAGAFFADYGFHPKGETDGERDVLEKDICFRPEFLGE